MGIMDIMDIMGFSRHRDIPRIFKGGVRMGIMDIMDIMAFLALFLKCEDTFL